MNPGDWAKVEAAFDALLALPAADRPAALNRLCGNDQALRRELVSLLAHVDGDDPLLDRPLLSEDGAVEPSLGSLPPGTRIGAYRLVALIGHGGMGEVYRAERADGQYSQAVALKLIRRELADQPARFQLERQTLARLDHPGIARLLDGGVAEDGRPFMVMELVSGATLMEWCRQHHSPLDERLELFLAMCAALEYAHRNLVVHRDLKPGNVLVTPEGAVKILDFGIAKLLGPAGAEMPTQNAPMTPGYAAPEQLTHGAITTATDVYALGMLLFELLAGARPWNTQELSLAAGIDTVLRAVPPAPSEVAGRQSDGPVPAKLLRGDLDAIVAKALRKEPERRYESVAALRLDIEKSRRHEPVGAREGARMYAAARFLRRHRTLVAGLCLTLLALLGGAAATLWQMHAARLEARRADAVRDFLLDIFQHNTVNNPDGAQARQTTAEQLLDIGAERIRAGLQEEPQVRSQVMEVLAELYDQLERFDKVADIERARLADIERHGNQPSADKAAAQWHLGRTMVMQGDYLAAYAELNAAIRTMDQIHDLESEQRAEALLETGRIAYHRATPDSLRSALAFAKESLEIYEKHAESGNPDRLGPLQLMARVAERRGQLSEAERLYREFVSQAQLPQFDGLPVLSARGHDDLGSLLLAERRYREAEPELRRAIELYSKAEGERQMDTAVAKAYLGQLLVAGNRGVEGEVQLRDALESVEQSQGGDNLPSTAVVRWRYARAAADRGNLSLAGMLLDRNLAAFESKNPDDRNYLPETLRTRAEVDFAAGHTDEALAHLARADRLWPVDAGNDGSKQGLDDVLRARIDLAAGRFTENDRAALERVRGTWPATPRELPAAYVWATLTLADADRQGRRTADAVQLSQGLLDRILAESEHEYLADWESRARLILGRSLVASGRSADARAHLTRAVQLRESFDEPSSPWLAEARSALAERPH